MGGDDEAALRRDGEGPRSAAAETPEAAALALGPEMREIWGYRPPFSVFAVAVR